MNSIIRVTCLFLILCIATSVKSWAQSDQMEARAAYLLAEESFDAGKYEDCLIYLSQATGKLGTANAKILYLKVVATQEMARKNATIIPQLREAINEFLNAPDISSFNEEKQMEVIKIKLKLPKDVIKDVAGSETVLATAKKYSIKGFVVGSDLESAKQANPDFFLIAKRNAGMDSTSEAYTLVESNGKGITVSFRKNKLAYLNYFEILASDNNSFGEGKKALSSFLTLFGGAPVVQTKEGAASKHATTHITTYTWKEEGVTATVTLLTGTYGKRSHQSNLTVFVSSNSSK